ncbi:hypothetical protein A8H33_05355 [Burkholderia vietnamiensis]|nr:hypothetical protein A8H33_05355 [Burkholderia vietnamiensis]
MSPCLVGSRCGPPHDCGAPATCCSRVVPETGAPMSQTRQVFDRCRHRPREAPAGAAPAARHPRRTSSDPIFC